MPERRAARITGPTSVISSVSGPDSTACAESAAAGHATVPNARAASSSRWSWRTNQRSLASVASHVPSTATRSARASALLVPVARISIGACGDARRSLTVPRCHAAKVVGSRS